MSRFQLIFSAILVVLGVAGAVLFAVARNQGSQSAPALTMWGTLDGRQVSDFLAKISVDYRDTVNVSYVGKDPATFESDLISALARGQGPDMVLLPQDLILKQLDKFYIIPYENYSQRLFKDSFIQEGELYMMSSGIVGLPFSVDPLVMYWNRDIFTNAGLATPPIAWTEFFGLVPKLTKKDQNGNISQSMVAFGEVRNVSSAKDIIALLTMQAGSPIVTFTNDGFKSNLADRGLSGLVPAESAVSFFTEFSNPVKASYSWNRAFSLDRTMFLAGRLALYFGYASELSGLRGANPNLNFDVAVMPQAEGNRMTFGRMNAIALLKTSPNVGPAYIAAVTLTSAPLQTEWLTNSGFPPVRRDMLRTLPSDAFQSVIYQSALISRAWLDPYREATLGTFMRLIEDVTSGVSRVSESVNEANLELDNLLRGNI
ncbi:MAG: extracellular solute-binding protein [bacterium]|nr:extracellular solute-binding protein [bacterium]